MNSDILVFQAAYQENGNIFENGSYSVKNY